MDITTLLKRPEDKTLEFKRDLSSPAGILRTLIAFSNTAGGTLVLGVEDKTKTICGVIDPLELEEKIANLIDDSIEPQLLPEIEVIPWKNHYLLAIEIYPSAARPHYLKKQGPERGTYIRVGSTNRPVDKIMLSELKRVKADDSFDKEPMMKLSIEDINVESVSKNFPEIEINSKTLESLDLIIKHQKRNVPTAGGIILYGKERLKYFPDAWIQAGRFQGKTKITIIDTQEIYTQPVSAVDDAIGFIKKHANRSIEIKGARHTEVWNLPIIALREAIINAVVHADYAQQGSPIRIAIFDDRIEIENPGLLLFGLTVGEIKQGISKLRNRVIGQIFYRLGLIERWGSGIRRIIDICKDLGYPEPIFEEIATHFRVTIFTQKNANPQINSIDELILEHLKKSNGLSTKEIAGIIKKSERTARSRLAALIGKGLVVEIGSSINDPRRKYYYKA